MTVVKTDVMSATVSCAKCGLPFDIMWVLPFNVDAWLFTGPCCAPHLRDDDGELSSAHDHGHTYTLTDGEQTFKMSWGHGHMPDMPMPETKQDLLGRPGLTYLLTVLQIAQWWPPEDESPLLVSFVRRLQKAVPSMPQSRADLPDAMGISDDASRHLIEDLKGWMMEKALVPETKDLMPNIESALKEFFEGKESAE